MSTRAIVKVQDGNEAWSIYCHGDGYPECVGALVNGLAHTAPYIDSNHALHHANQRHWREKLDNAWWDRYSPFGHVPNVAGEASKFAAALLGWMWKKGYTHAYLTTRDAEQEKAHDQYGTDIEWLYKVTFPNGQPVVETLEL